MNPYSFNYFFLLVLDALSRLGGADIAISEIRDGADDKPGLVVGSGNHDHFIFRRFGCTPYNMDVEKFQKFPGSIQESGRIVISCRDNYMAVWSGRHSAKETVIQLLRMVAGRAVVEHISRYQQNIDVFALDERRQPVQEGFKLFRSLAAIKSATDVPVGGM